MRNEYDDRYIIRLANKGDINDIMSFIDTHWKKGHIMATDHALFEYEFLEDDGTVNFVIAIDRKKGKIEGLNGFLKASHDKAHLDIWGSIWKVVDGCKGMLGAEIIKRRAFLTQCRCDLDVGSNPRTAIPVMKHLLKHYTAKMNHYYMLADREDYKIAKVIHKREPMKRNTDGKVIRFNDMNSLRKYFNSQRFIDSIPYKDDWYIGHRFFDYPIYKYEVYGIINNEKAEGIIVLRRQNLNGRIAIRVVDYIGNPKVISSAGNFFYQLLDNQDVEYIDFYCHGFNNDAISEAGFILLDENDENIIPNYFSPFLQENIEIWVDSAKPNSLFSKADADQDRPN